MKNDGLNRAIDMKNSIDRVINNIHLECLLLFLLLLLPVSIILTFSSLTSGSDSEQLSKLTVATPNEALGNTVVDGVVGLIKSILSSLSSLDEK